MLDVHLKELHAVLVNVYSPNTVGEQIVFFHRIRVALTIFNSQQLPVLIGGDFNVAFDPNLDKAGGSNYTKRSVVNEIRLIQADWNLVDCWRELHPYTLDCWLIPGDLMQQIEDCWIRNLVLSGHKTVVFQIKGPYHRSRGPGIWRLNSMVL
jgi:hypothetical protein